MLVVVSEVKSSGEGGILGKSWETPTAGAKISLAIATRDGHSTVTGSSGEVVVVNASPVADVVGIVVYGVVAGFSG